MNGSKNMKQTLLVVMVMIASAILPMMPEAAELMNKERAKNTDIMVDTYHNGSITLYEGDWFAYEISIEEAPNGVLVVTPTTNNSDTTNIAECMKYIIPLQRKLQEYKIFFIFHKNLFIMMFKRLLHPLVL